MFKGMFDNVSVKTIMPGLVAMAVMGGIIYAIRRAPASPVTVPLQKAADIVSAQ